LQNIEEDFEGNKDGDQIMKNTEIVIGSFNFICNTFASMGMQTKILTHKILHEIFEFFQYLSGITNSKFLDIYSLMLM